MEVSFVHMDKTKKPKPKPLPPKPILPTRRHVKKMMENLQQREALEKPKPPPKAPEKPKLTPRRGQIKANFFENLQQYFGHKRKGVAVILEVSVSKFERVCRLQGIPRWRNQMGSSGSVSKPPDQHGERNTSTACETPSHNVQTGMEGVLFGQNEVASVFRRDFMGGPIALNTESGLIMVSRPPNQHGERNTSTACGTPSCNVETGMEVEPVGQNPEANVFRQDFMGGPIALNTDGLTFPECSDAVAPSQPMATILNTIPHLIGDSSECAFQVKNQSTQFTANPYPNGLVDPHPQIALTQILSENMERLEDRRNLLAPQKEPPDNSAHLVRANQSGPIMLNSEKKHTSEGLIGECLTESVLSLDDSTKRKSFPDFDATENKAHLVRAYQSGSVVSLSENKNEGEALKRECITKSILGLGDLQQHCGGRSDAAAKSFRAIYDPGLHTTDSVTWKSFEELETHRPREQQSNATDTDQERQIQTQMCNELSDARGGRPDAAAKSFRAIYDPGFHTPDSVARKSFEVLETLPARKQPNDGVPLLLPGRLTLEGCVQQEKSPDLPRVMQFNGVEQRVTKMPRYLGGLTAQSASSSCGPIGLPDGGHIVLLDALDQSTKNIEHAATADQCSPTLSLPENKMERKTLNRNCRTMSVIFEEKHQRFVRRCEGATKSLGAMCISRKHGINQVSMVELIHKQRGIHQWPFLRSAVGLPDGGHILSLLEKKIVRKTLKRKCRSMSVLSLEDHKQHVDRRWEDAAKSHGAKHICWQLVIHRLSTAKCIRKQIGIHQWPFQQSTIGLPDGGHILPLSEKKIVRKTLKRKCRSMSVLSLVDRQQHVDRRWEDAAKNIGAKRICRQLVIHRVSIAKRICRQHGIHHRWPFERDWATMKGYSFGDERPVEVIRLYTDGKLVSRRRRIYISWLGRFSPWRSALPRGLIVGPIALSSSEFAGTNNIAQRVTQDQRGSGSSGSENERTREQEDPREINTNINYDLRRHSGRITIDNLRPLFGVMNRTEAADHFRVSVPTFKRACRACGINEWPRVKWKKGAERKKKRRKKDEWRLPDQHGGNNPSPTCRTMATNGLTEIQNVMVGQDPNEFFLTFFDGPTEGMPDRRSLDDFRNLFSSLDVPPQGSDQPQIMSRLPENDQSTPQCGLPIVVSNEGVASNPDGGPVNPVERERTPEAHNDPIVPASGSHLVASTRSVNIADTTNESFSQTDSDLARLAAEIEAVSESLKSQTGSPESSLPPSFLQYGEEVQAQVDLFFDLLKLPFEELVMNKSKELTDCMSILVQKRVFPLKEHIVLEIFFNNSSDTFSLFKYHNEEMRQKKELLNSFSSISTKVSNMQSEVLSVKSQLSALDQEENSLLLRLEQILAEKNALLQKKDGCSREFEKLKEEVKGVSAQTTAARADLLRNDIKRTEMIKRWENLLTFFANPTS